MHRSKRITTSEFSLWGLYWLDVYKIQTIDAQIQTGCIGEESQFVTYGFLS